jgi:hypothetical protein
MSMYVFCSWCMFCNTVDTSILCIGLEDDDARDSVLEAKNQPLEEANVDPEWFFVVFVVLGETFRKRTNS